MDLFGQNNRLPYIQATTESSTIIAWQTAIPGPSELHWGLDGNNLDQELIDNVPKTRHHFEITGLTPGTTYYYEVISPIINAGVNFFETAKEDLQQPFSFLHYGDCGYNNSVQNTIATLMEMETVDFGIVSGDIDQGFGDNYDQVYFGVYQDILKTDCHYTCIGNHDTYADGAATYLEEFYLLDNNPQQSERYYSYTWGNAKFICIDSNLPYTNGTTQYNWLIDEMRCNDREWLFVFFHHPPWTNAWSLDYYIPFTPFFQYEGNEDMRNTLVPAFEQFDVDFVLNGHAHCYQRGELNGVNYVISGGAGASTIDINTNSNSPNIDTELYINQYVRFDMHGDTAKYICIDINGNLVDEVTVVKSFTPYLTTITTNNASCASGGFDGSATAIVNGSFAPFTYLWPNGSTSATVSNLGAGTYEVEITDSRGCAKTETFTIGLSGDLMITPVQLDATCVNSSDGIAGVNVSGSGTYSYLWSTGDTNSSAAGLTPGDYTITVTSTSGCTAIEQFEINAINVIEPEIVSVDGSFSFCNNGSIMLETTESYFGYQWSNGATTSSITVNSPGNYAVTVSSPIGCEGFASAVEVIQNFSPTIDLEAENAACPNSMDGSVTADVEGGSGAYFYSWSTGITTSMISGLSPGSYSLTVYDSNGCISEVTQSISYNQELPIAEFGFTQNELTIDLDASNSLNAIQYQWDFGDNTNGSGQTVTHTYTEAGVYTVTLTVINDCGSEAVEMTVVIMTTSINDPLSNGFEVLVSPNPFYETVILDFNNEKLETFELQVFSESGILVLENVDIKGKSLEVNLSDSPPGIYFYSLKSKDKQAIGKLTKLH